MNAFMCLAISSLLVGLLFIYMRQQVSGLEKRVDQLTSVVKTLAHGLPKEAEAPEPEPEVTEVFAETKVYVSDDSDSESDCDEVQCEEVKCDFMLEPSGVLVIDETNILEMMSRVMQHPPQQNIEVFDMDNIPVEVEYNNEPKQIVIEGVYDSLSVKELKEKVAALGGPASLKTRKALLEFLAKKIE